MRFTSSAETLSHTDGPKSASKIEKKNAFDLLTYARKSALVWTLGPFWRNNLKWLPPTRLSQHVQISGFP